MSRLRSAFCFAKRGELMPQIRRCRFPGCHAVAYVPNHYCKKHIEHEAELQKRNNFYRFHRYNNSTRQRYYNKVVRNRNPIKAEQNRFYHSKQWKDMRLIVLKRDYSLCRYCKALGKVKEGNVIDHVLPVERFPDHMKDLQNLVTCCQECHYWKTRFEEQYYGTGLHGKPTDNPPITDVKLIANLAARLKNDHAVNG